MQQTSLRQWRRLVCCMNNAADQSAPLAIHAVHFTPYPPTLLEGWTEEVPLSRIVIIGKGLDELAIRKALMQF